MTMKKIIILSVLFYAFVPVYSQSESSLIKEYEQKIIENNNLKNDLKSEKQLFSKLSNAYKKDTLELQKSIKNLQKDLSIKEQKILDLNEDPTIKNNYWKVFLENSKKFVNQ